MNPAPIKPLISTSDLDKIDVPSGPFSLLRTWRIRRSSYGCVSIEPTSLTTNSARLESKPAIARKARETAVWLGTAKQRPRADVKNVDGKSRHSSLMAAR